MQNMSTEDDRTAFCKEICQEKKSVQKKRKNTWLLITEVIFNIKSSQPVIFSQTFMEAFLSLYIYECAFGWVHKGVVGCSSLEGEMYKRELDLTTSCCPVHLTAGTSPPSTILTCSSPLLDSLEMGSGQMLGYQLLLLPVLKLFSGHESAMNIMAYTCSLWRERKEKVFQRKQELH